MKRLLLVGALLLLSGLAVAQAELRATDEVVLLKQQLTLMVSLNERMARTYELTILSVGALISVLSIASIGGTLFLADRRIKSAAEEAETRALKKMQEQIDSMVDRHVGNLLQLVTKEGKVGSTRIHYLSNQRHAQSDAFTFLSRAGFRSVHRVDRVADLPVDADMVVVDTTIGTGDRLPEDDIRDLLESVAEQVAEDTVIVVFAIGQHSPAIRNFLDTRSLASAANMPVALVGTCIDGAHVRDT